MRFLGLWGLWALAGCTGNPTGEDATLEVQWCVYGQTADADWCALAGIETVRMVEDGDPVEDFEWPCADGTYVSQGPVLGAGDYFLRFEGVDGTGYVVASTPDPEVAPDDHVTVEEGDDIRLVGYDLVAGQKGDLAVDLGFETDRGFESCEDAGVTRVGYEFMVEACDGERHGRGKAVYADDAGGGVPCDEAELALRDVPYGVYAIHVTAFSPDDAWSAECDGLTLREASLDASTCEVSRTR